jgi:hypothetical protein
MGMAWRERMAGDRRSLRVAGRRRALEFGVAEMCFVVCGTVASIVGLTWSLHAIARASRQ